MLNTETLIFNIKNEVYFSVIFDCNFSIDLIGNIEHYYENKKGIIITDLYNFFILYKLKY